IIQTNGTASSGKFLPAGSSTALGTTNPSENHARMLSDGSWWDLNESNTFNYVVQWDASEVLSSSTFSLTDDAGGRFAIDSSTGEITVADGSLIDVETAASHDVTVEVTDAAGNSYSESMSIAIDDEFDAHGVTPGPQFVTEGQTLTFSSGNGNAVTVSDSISGTNREMQVTLSVNHGDLTLSQTTGLTFLSGSNGSGSFVLSGTESDINAALEGMTFTPDADFNGSVTLNLTTALAADLEGHYTFDDGTATDQAAGATSHDGSLLGGASINADATRGSNVLVLDGVDGNVQINTPLTQSQHYTMAAWINSSSSIPEGEVISFGGNVFIRMGSDGTLSGYYRNAVASSWNQSVTDPQTWESGWNHVAYSVDASNNVQRLFINGVQVAETNFTEAIHFTGTATYLGSNGGVSQFFDGSIDDARVYTRALSAEEIAALAGEQTESTQAVEINVLDPITTTATSEGGLSINADGGDDAYLVADDGGALLGGRTSLSFETQFSSDTLASPDYMTLVSYATPTNTNEVLFEIRGNGNVGLTVAGASLTSTAIDYHTLLRDGGDHSIGFTWDGSNGNWAIYVNGEVVDSTSIAGGTLLAYGQTIEGGGTLVFGQEQDALEGGFSTAQVFEGTLYDVRVFDDVRTANEIAASYRSDLPYNEAGMLANWRFDQLSTDGVVVDAVSGNNLTVKHTTQSGFISSDVTLTFGVDENAIDGTVVGSVAGNDVERQQQIQSLLDADPNLRYSAETGKFYKISSAGNVDWTTALSAAAGENLSGITSQIVTIRSAAENELLRGFGEEAGFNEFWIGATDATVENEWRWLESGVEADQFWEGDANGYQTAYHNWLAGQPNDGDSADQAVLVVSSGIWGDRPASHNNFVLVEWSADEVLDANQATTYSIQSQTVSGAFAIDSSTGQITVADGTLLDADTNATHTISVRT
ncbi:MAG: LamG-like jellyroll fold domain-containing protein, partial [Planctomycetota bacterium]